MVVINLLEENITSAKPRPFKGGPAAWLGDDLPSFWAWRDPSFVLVFLLFLFVFLAVSQLIVLQLFEGDYNLALSQENSLQRVPLKAERGLIVDREGKTVAGNEAAFDLYFYPSLCRRQNCSRPDLAGYSFFTAEVADRLSRASEVEIVRDLPQAEALKLSGQIANQPYFKIKEGQKRQYPQGESLFHVLGYVSRVSQGDLEERSGLKLSDKVGRLGLEKVYDEFLRGRDGGEIYETNAQGEVLRKVRLVPAVAGHTLVLNLDQSLQGVAYQALSAAVKNSKALGGALVAQDPKTGRVLALVSLPGVDANIFSSFLSAADFAALEDSDGQPFFNRATAGAFAPGSVFKIVVAAAALNLKLVTPQTLIDGPGSISLGAFTFRDWRPEGHGRLTIADAIGESCDTCFYILGGGYGGQKGVGADEIAKMSRLFGLGEVLGLDLPGETPGLVPDSTWKKNERGLPWYIGDTYHYAIGQGFLLTTPLQINSLTAAVANGGNLFRPYLVDKILDAAGNEVRRFEPHLVRRGIIDESYLAMIKEGLIKVARPGGTAYPLYDFKVPVAGKTGTAETGKGTTHAWFTVFAPVKNPQIALTVFLEEGGEGSRDAAPVAREILEEFFK